MNLTNLKDVLEAREARVEKQCGLLSDRGVLVSFTLNIPGPVKNAVLYRMVFEDGLGRLKNMEELSGAYLESGKNAAGPYAFFAVKENGGIEPAKLLKQKTMQLEEETGLGRLFDIDVLYCGVDGFPVKVSRTELGGQARSCLVCGEKAFACVRSARHSVPEVLMCVIDRILYSEEIEKRIFQSAAVGLAEKIALEAVRAMMYEVITTPKPGLVDAENNGAHKDMDITVFFDSAVAVAPYLRDCVQIGMDHAKEPAKTLLPVLRPLGIKAEEEMYRATGGVNTHKGAIFTMGIFCAAAGMLSQTPCLCHGTSDLPALAGKIASPMENGSRGIRTEAREGYPSLVAAMKAVYRSDSGNACSEAGKKKQNEDGVRLLLELMSRVDDSNIVRRKGEEASAMVRERAGNLLAGNEGGEELIRKAAELDREMIRENLSPGGSADLLAAAYFLRFTSPLLNGLKSSRIQSLCENTQEMTET